MPVKNKSVPGITTVARNGSRTTARTCFQAYIGLSQSVCECNNIFIQPDVNEQSKEFEK